LSGSRADALRAQILGLVREYHDEAFASQPFVPGESSVPFAGRVFDADEVEHLVDSSLDFWLTTGRFAERFEKRSPSSSASGTPCWSTRGPPPTSSRCRA
jgi:CDP-6-deoxy-D-xylo-4-hexulose-3-dehydrase